jgi:hypothetical protein
LQGQLAPSIDSIVNALFILTVPILKRKFEPVKVIEIIRLIMSLPLAAHLPQAEQREHRGEELSSDQSNLPVEEPAHGLDTCDSIEKLDSPPSADESETPARETEPSTQNANDATNTSGVVKNKPHSVFNHNEKRLIILCAGICSFFSPVSGSIYLPALDAIAGDLHVSYSLITLSVTTYMASHLSY